MALLFAVPFLGKGKAQHAADRPLALAAGVSRVIAIVYLALMGFAGARPYGKEIPVPARQLTVSEQRGCISLPIAIALTAIRSAAGVGTGLDRTWRTRFPKTEAGNTSQDT